MVTESDISLAGGRTLHAYDTRADGSARRPDAPGSPAVVFWLHGSPNVGSPPEPLFAAAEANGLRWVSYDRPGYGGSSPHDGRTVASAAADVVAIADALGIGRFAVLGHSGGREMVLGGRRAFALRPGQAPDSWSRRWALRGSDLVVDAELGIVLRSVWRVAGKPAFRCEFRDVTAGRYDDAEFRANVPPGARVVHSGGGLLDDLTVTLPDPVRAAAKAAGSGLRAAREFLDSRSGRRGR